MLESAVEKRRPPDSPIDDAARRVRAAARGAVGRAGPCRRARSPRARSAGASTPGSSRASCSASVSATWSTRRWTTARLPFYDKDTLPLKKTGARRRRAHRAGRLGDSRRRVPRARRHLHAADVREHRRLRRRGIDDRLARAGRIVRPGRRARPRQRRRADRRRHRAGWRAAGHHRGRGADWRQHRHLRRRDRQGAGGRSRPGRC